MHSGGPPVHLMWSNVFDPNKPQVHKPVQWRRIAALFLPYWKQELKVLVCILAVSLLGLLPPLFALWIIDKAIPHADMALLCLFVCGMILSAIAAGLVGVYQGYMNSIVGEGIMRDMRTSLVSHLHRMPRS